jgi:transcription initiation factor IIE alpha subunit
MSITPPPQVPEEFRVLSMMHNIGAISPERSLTAEELAQWTEIDISTVRAYLQKLREDGYVELVDISGTQRYLVTRIGIMKVLTLYS